MPWVVRRWFALVTLLASCAWSVLALAQPSAQDRAGADALFREARALMAGKKWTEACPKLAESQRLDPQAGTLLNLAVCHAREGKSATAWAEFQEALELAKSAGRNDRVKLAERELARLEKKLARVSIEVLDPARVPGLAVKRNGEVVAESAYGAAVPVDPGKIQISASAPGYAPFSADIEVQPTEQKTIVIGKLDELPREQPAAPAKKPPPAAEPEPRPRSSTLLTVGYVSAGVGIVALGVGSYFGLSALSNQHDANDHCNGNLCDPDGLDASDRAHRDARISNVAFGVGAIATGAGIYLVLSQGSNRPEKGGENARVGLVPCIGPSSGAMLWSGRW